MSLICLDEDDAASSEYNDGHVLGGARRQCGDASVSDREDRDYLRASKDGLPDFERGYRDGLEGLARDYRRRIRPLSSGGRASLHGMGSRTISARMPLALHGRYMQLGGAAWLRRQLEVAPLDGSDGCRTAMKIGQPEVEGR